MATGWTELAHRCFVRRYDSFDLSCGIVAGGESLLVVDSRVSAVEGAELARHVRELSSLPVNAVVNTHVHFDHTFGNGALRQAWPGVQLVAHESVPVTLAEHEARIKRLYTDDVHDTLRDDVLATEVVPPDTVFSSLWSVDLGDRVVEVVHPGRGHTDGDVVIRVPDSDVAYAGDLVEESGPLSYGPDCWPLEWPQTLELLIGLLGPETVVVPGHGAPVDKQFVLEQRADAAAIAGQVHQLATAGVAVEEAAQRGTWPYATEGLVQAVRRGYSHLSR